MNQSIQRGMIHPLLLSTIVLTVLVIGLGGFAIWSYVNYQNQKNHVDAIVAAAVSDAKREQQEADDKVFAEREKEPTRQLVGPEDLGRVTFNYPKTWSVYLEKTGAGGQFEAYLHPQTVPPIGNNNTYALRVSVVPQSYEQSVNEYQNAVKAGDLKASPIALKGQNGTRLDGNFTKTTQGSMVLFKVRDKTLKVFTQSKVFIPDFDTIVLQTLVFNP